MTLRDAPVDALPEFTPAYVEIQTESLGLSASEVEQLLTVPLEADLLNGVEGVDVIRSSSLPGLSSIVLVFEPGTDVYKGRQLVQERLTQLGGAAFPNVSKPPTMLQPLSSSSRVMMIGLSSESLTPIQKSVLARWTLRPRLMGVEGVANVAVWGMRDQQIQVQVDPERLRDKGVTLSQVISTAGNAQIASPVSYLEASVPGTGGFIETPQQRLQVRNVFDKIADPKELGKVTVEGSGGKLRLADVANVVENHQPLIGDAVVNDKDGLLLVVEKFPGADAKDVSEGVEDALEKLAPGLSGLQTDTSVFRPADVIDEALDNLTTAIIIGALLLVLALVAVLMRWRTLLVVLVTIPTSLVAAAIVLDLLGETFNAITFAGLALALAIIVDDAVTRGREHRPAPGAAARRGQRGAGRRDRARRDARDPLAARLRRAHRAARHRAGGDHGGPAGRVPRSARGRLRRGGPDRDGHGADADAGAGRPAQAGRTRLGAAGATARRLRRPARQGPRPARRRARERRAARPRGGRRPAGHGAVAAADAQGPQRARPARRRSPARRTRA